MHVAGRSARSGRGYRDGSGKGHTIADDGRILAGCDSSGRKGLSGNLR